MDRKCKDNGNSEGNRLFAKSHRGLIVSQAKKRYEERRGWLGTDEKRREYARRTSIDSIVAWVTKKILSWSAEELQSGRENPARAISALAGEVADEPRKSAGIAAEIYTAIQARPQSRESDRSIVAEAATEQELDPAVVAERRDLIITILQNARAAKHADRYRFAVESAEHEIGSGDSDGQKTEPTSAGTLSARETIVCLNLENETKMIYQDAKRAAEMSGLERKRELDRRKASRDRIAKIVRPTLNPRTISIIIGVATVLLPVLESLAGHVH